MTGRQSRSSDIISEHILPSAYGSLSFWFSQY